MKTIILALAPIVIILLFLYGVDKEKESKKYLIKALLLGVVSTIPAALIGSIFTIFEEFTFFYYIVFVGIIEEACKGMAAYLTFYKTKEVNHRFDTIIFFTFSALGFAGFENVLYLAFNTNITLPIIRGFVSVPGHICYGAIMGYYFEKFVIFKKENDFKKAKKALLKSLFIPAVIHGCYDAIIMTISKMTSDSKTVLALAFLFIMFIFNICIFIKIYIESKKSNVELNDIDLSLSLKKKNNMMNQVVQPNDTLSLTHKFCPNCGNAGNSSFCTNCGADLRIK